MLHENAISAAQVMRPRTRFAAPTDRVFDVTQELLRTKDRARPVVTEGNRLVGIITERDCVKALIRAVHHALPPSQVEDVMTREAVTVKKDASLLVVAHVFHKHPVSVLPVMDGPVCLGVVTRAEVLARAVKIFKKAPNREAAILYVSALGRDAPV